MSTDLIIDAFSVHLPVCFAKSLIKHKKNIKHVTLLVTEIERKENKIRKDKKAYRRKWCKGNNLSGQVLLQMFYWQRKMSKRKSKCQSVH